MLSPQLEPSGAPIFRVDYVLVAWRTTFSARHSTCEAKARMHERKSSQLQRDILRTWSALQKRGRISKNTRKLTIAVVDTNNLVQSHITSHLMSSGL